MIRLAINKCHYSYERVIFPSGLVESNADIVRYMRFYEKPSQLAKIEWDSYRTPITKLSKPQEEIRAQYSKKVRYEVRRARREGIEFTIYDKLDLGKDAWLIEDVQEKYYSFCDQAGVSDLKANLDPSEFVAMVANGNLIVTKAAFENGWTYHVYQADGINALLWFSFSDYRKEGSNKSMAGWANRGLHDADIMFFNESGYQTYDWGNIASEVSPNQIDKFKLSFGGELRTAYCCFVGNTLKGKALIAARRIKNARETR